MKIPKVLLFVCNKEITWLPSTQVAKENLLVHYSHYKETNKLSSISLILLEMGSRQHNPR